MYHLHLFLFFIMASTSNKTYHCAEDVLPGVLDSDSEVDSGTEILIFVFQRGDD